MQGDTTRTTILVAEDDDEDYLVVLEGLKDAGLFHELVRVKDGQELLDWLYGGNPAPSLLLLDLNMPRIDGREALLRLKSDPDLASLPVAVLTSSQSEEDVIRAYGFGVPYYMRKPVEFGQIMDIVRAVDESKSRRAELEAQARKLPAV